jgi:hypothetical protein
MFTVDELKLLEERITARVDTLIFKDEYQEIGSNLVGLIVGAIQEYEIIKNNHLK